MKKDSKSESSANLRQRAEELYKKNLLKSGLLKDDAQTLKLIHDLEVHKIELEMQNEELRLAKEKITADAEKYADLYDFAPSGYFTLSQNGEIIALNLCGSQMLGKDRAFLKSKMFGLYVSDDSKPIFSRFLDTIFSSKSQDICEVALQVNNNLPMYVHLSGSVTENGEQCLVIATDITDRKLSEAALRESNEMFSAFMRHSPIYTFIKEVNQQESRVLKASENFRDMIGICGSEMAGKTMYQLFPAEYAAKFTADDWKVVSGGEGITLDEDLNGRNYTSIKFPIDLGGKTLLAGYTIDITERKQAEAALRESEKQYSNLFTNFLDSVAVHQIVLDETGKLVDYIFLQANAAFEEQTGLHVADILGKRVTEVIPGIEKTPLIDIYGKVTLTGEPVTFEQFFEPLQRYFHISAFQVSEDRFCTVFQDITQQKQADEALRQSKIQLELAHQSAGAGTWDWDMSSQHLNWSKELYALFGLDPGSVEASFDIWNRVVHPDDLAVASKYIEQAVKEKMPLDSEYRVIHPNGEVHWINALGNTTYDDSGKPFHMAGLCTDITRRKQAEEALIESESRLHRVYDSGMLGILYWNMNGQIIDANDKFLEIVGYSKDDLVTGKIDWMNMTPPEFRYLDENSVAELTTSGVNKSPFEKEYIRKDGTRVPILISGAMLDEERFNGVAFVVDITERKRAEEALIESERKFRHTVINLDEGYYSVTMDGVLLEHNQAFSRILGFDANADLKGIHLPDFWQYPDKRKKYLEAISANDSISNYQIEVKTQTGEKRSVLANAHLVKDENGQPIRIEGVFLDITERIRLEESLQRHAGRLQNLHKIDKAILSAVETPEAIIQKTLHHIRSLLSSQHASIGMFDFENEVLQLFCSNIRDQSIDVAKRYLISNALGDLEILREKKMDVVENISLRSLPPDLQRIFHAEGVMSCINVPLISGDKLIGAMNLGWEDPRTFTPEELEIAGEVADEITVAIEQVRLRQAAKHYAEELEKRVEKRTSQLLAANKELEAFSYSVSHDLRAPLRHINGYISILSKHLKDILPEKEKHYFDTITDSARQMGKLIDDLLHFSRTGRQEMQLTNLEMNAVLKDALQVIQHESFGRGIKWVVAGLPQVTGDYALLRLVWLNLLSNAVKFGRANIIPQIEIGVVDDVHEFVFFVRDNGVGFDMQYAHKLFGVFERLHSAQEFEGTGIGLANVRRIIQRHGGRTWAEAEINKGATFYFSLPKG